MIQALVDRFMKKKKLIAKAFEDHPSHYINIVEAVVSAISEESPDCDLDYSRIHEICNGGYKGELLYIIPSKYSRAKYWFVIINYGSCSGCDTLKAIRKYEYGKPSKNQVKDYMTLALHIVQGLKVLE
jgi:hypothetical protein